MLLEESLNALFMVTKTSAWLDGLVGWRVNFGLAPLLHPRTQGPKSELSLLSTMSRNPNWYLAGERLGFVPWNNSLFECVFLSVKQQFGDKSFFLWKCLSEAPDSAGEPTLLGNITIFGPVLPPMVWFSKFMLAVPSFSCHVQTLTLQDASWHGLPLWTLLLTWPHSENLGHIRRKTFSGPNGVNLWKEVGWLGNLRFLMVSAFGLKTLLAYTARQWH